MAQCLASGVKGSLLAVSWRFIVLSPFKKRFLAASLAGPQEV
jgi:hypothetical protein